MPDTPELMRCFEVRGGNTATDDHVALPGLDAWVYAQPHGGAEAGGDLHYLSNCGTGRITRMLVADVSGHGSVVADTAARLRSLMRRYVNYIDQTRFVERLNREFLSLEKLGAYATGVVATYFGPTRRLDLCNAGHPWPLWYRAKTRRWEVLEERPASGGSPGPAAGGSGGRPLVNLPIGLIEPTRYRQFGVRLEPADLVLFCTDSLTEASGGDDEMLGESGLLDLVRALDATRPADLVPALLDRLAAFRGGRPADDDVTIVLVHHHGQRAQAPFSSWLGAGVRFAQDALGRWRPGAEPLAWPEPSVASIGGPFIKALNRRWKGVDGAAHDRRS